MKKCNKAKLFVIVCLFFIGCVGLCIAGGAGVDFKAYAEDVVNEVLFTDDCTSLDSANISDKSANLIAKNEGDITLISRTSDSQGYVTFSAGGIMNSAKIQFWCDDGKSGIDYAFASGIKIFGICASTTADGSFTDVEYTYLANTDNDKLIDVTVESFPAGSRYLRITMEGNVTWRPGLVSVTVNGTKGGSEGDTPTNPEPGLPTETPFFTDLCTDLIEVYSFDKNIKNDARGITRSSSEPGSIVYGAKENIGRIEAVLNVFGGYEAWKFDVNKQNYNIRLFVGQAENGPFAEVKYTASEKKSKGSDGWGQVAIVSDNITSEVKYARLLLDTSGTSWFVCIRSVSLFALDGDATDVLSVVISNETLEFVAGESLVFSAETDPENLLVWFKAFDDEEMLKLSSYASFDGNVLSADFYDAVDRTVWVVAISGDMISEPVAVTIHSRPNPSNIVLTADKYSFVSDEYISLYTTVTPTNSIVTLVEYAAYLDEGCTEPALGVLIDGTKLTLDESFRSEVFWLVAYIRGASGSVESEPVQFSVSYKEVVKADNCIDLSKVDGTLSDKDFFRIENNAIRKIFGDTLTGGGLDYSALGIGSSRTDHHKYEVPSLVYTVPVDLGSLTFSLIVYDEGNGALQPANKNSYVGLVNIYMSVDGKDWTYVGIDFTATTDVGSNFASAYTKLNYFNNEELPLGVRYVRIDFLGQISKREIKNGDSYTYDRYQGGVTKEEDYKDIVLFYNSYSPFLSAITFYAVNGAMVQPVLSSLRGEEGMWVYAGGNLEITLYQEFANEPGVFSKLKDYSNVVYTIIEGANLVQFTNGSNRFSVKQEAFGESAVIRFRATIGDVVSNEIALRVLIPVSSVVVSAEKTQIAVGETIALTASVAPYEASFPFVGWYIAEGVGYISADGVFTATEEGLVKIVAIADGVSSETFEIVITSALESGPEHNPNYSGSSSSDESKFGLPVLASIGIGCGIAVVVLICAGLVIMLNKKSSKN